MVAIIVILWKKCETFRNVVKAIWAGMKAGAAAVAGFLKKVFTAVWRALTATAKGYANVVKAIWRAIKAGANAVIGWLRSAWKAVWGVLKAAAKGYQAVLKAVWLAIKFGCRHRARVAEGRLACGLRHPEGRRPHRYRGRENRLQCGANGYRLRGEQGPKI